MPGHGVGIHLEVPSEPFASPQDVQHLVVLLGLRVARDHLHGLNDEYLAVGEHRGGPELVAAPAEGRSARLEGHGVARLPAVEPSQVLDHLDVHSLPRVNFQFQLDLIADWIQYIRFAAVEKRERKFRRLGSSGVPM